MYGGTLGLMPEYVKTRILCSRKILVLVYSELFGDLEGAGLSRGDSAAPHSQFHCSNCTCTNITQYAQVFIVHMLLYLHVAPIFQSLINKQQSHFRRLYILHAKQKTREVIRNHFTITKIESLIRTLTKNKPI